MNAQKIMSRLGVELSMAQKVLGLMEGMISPMEFKAVQEWCEQSYHVPPRQSEQVMCALNEVLKGYGVEMLVDKRDKVRAEYVNMGDTYLPTVLYDLKRGRFEVMSWGDFVEENNL